MPEMSRDRLEEYYRLFVLEDDVLVGLSSVPPSLNDARMTSLRQLPPWRAVMLARIATSVGAMTIHDRDRLIKEARDVGGGGTLRTWDAEKALIKRALGVD